MAIDTSRYQPNYTEGPSGTQTISGYLDTQTGRVVSEQEAAGITTTPTETTASGIDLSGSAADITAALLREQYENWVSQYQPIELKAINMLSYNNPEVLSTAVDKATSAATQSSDSMSGILQRTNARLGLKSTDEQAATSKRLMDLEKAKSVAGSANSARAAIREQDEQILLGTASNPISSLKSSS